MNRMICLNPCSSGRRSRTDLGPLKRMRSFCLNPCCSGRWSRTPDRRGCCSFGVVLILIVVEDGHVRLSRSLTLRRLSLNPYCNGRWSHTANAFTVPTSVSLVLILIIVNDGLVHIIKDIPSVANSS